MKLKSYSLALLLIIISLGVLVSAIAYENSNSKPIKVPVCSIKTLKVHVQNNEVFNDTLFLHINGNASEWGTLQTKILPVPAGESRDVLLYIHAPCQANKEGIINVFIDSFYTHKRTKLSYKIKTIEGMGLEIYADSTKKQGCIGESVIFYLKIINNNEVKDEFLIKPASPGVSVQKSAIINAKKSEVIPVYIQPAKEGLNLYEISFESRTTGITNSIKLEVIAENCTTKATPVAENSFCASFKYHSPLIKNNNDYPVTYKAEALLNNQIIDRKIFNVSSKSQKRVNLLLNPSQNLTQLYMIKIYKRNKGHYSLIANYTLTSIPVKLCSTPLIINKTVTLSQGKGSFKVKNTGTLPANYEFYLNQELFKITPDSIILRPGEEGTVTLHSSNSLNKSHYVVPVIIKANNIKYTTKLDVYTKKTLDRSNLFILLIIIILLLLNSIVLVIIITSKKPARIKKEQRVLKEFETFKKEVKKEAQEHKKRFYHHPIFWVVLATEIVLLFIILWISKFSLTKIWKAVYGDVLLAGDMFYNWWTSLIVYRMYFLMGVLILIIIISFIIANKKIHIIKALKKRWNKYKVKRKVKKEAREEAKKEYEELRKKRKPTKTPPKPRKLHILSKKLINIIKSPLTWVIIFLLAAIIIAIILAKLNIVNFSWLGRIAKLGWIWLVMYLPYILLGLIILFLVLLILKLIENYKRKVRKSKKEVRKKVKRKPAARWLPVIIILLLLVMGYMVFLYTKPYLTGMIQKQTPSNITQEQAGLNLTNLTETPKRLIWGSNSMKIINMYDYFMDPDNDTLNFSVSLNKHIFIDFDRKGKAYLLPFFNWYGIESVYFSAYDNRGGGIDSPRIDLIVLKKPFKENKYYLVLNNLSARRINLKNYIIDPDGFPLKYYISGARNISAEVHNNIALLRAPENYTGVEVLRITGQDIQGVNTTTPVIQVLVNTSGQFYGGKKIKLSDYTGFLVFVLLLIIFIIALIKLQEQ